MRIALFIKNRNVDIIHILVLDVQGNEISCMEDCYIFGKNLNYLSLWLISKQVQAFYIQGADDKIREYFHKLDIKVKTYEDLKADGTLHSQIPSFSLKLFEVGQNLISDGTYRLQSISDFYRIPGWMD